MLGSINKFQAFRLTRNFNSSCICRGFEEFYDVKKPNEVFTTGRAWTAADLRRKSFDDLHKLWFVLYKERNLLLTDKEKTRRAQRPVTGIEESRYLKVKRSMGAIKFVMNERKKIDSIVNPKIARPDPSSTMMDGI